MIDVQREGEVFVLRMREGENRINRPFLEALSRALDEVEASEGNAALVSTGEERFYSTGLDLEWLAGEGVGQAQPLFTELYRLFARLLTFPMATVAAINGHAFAAGAMIAAAHDFRVMRSDRGYWCLPEIDLAMGQPLSPGMYALLEARIARPTLHEALVTGRRFTAPQAAERGLVDEAQAEAEVLPRAIEIASRLAGKDRATMAALKRGLYPQALEVLDRPAPDPLEGMP